MHMHMLIVAVALLAVGGGCKSKKEMPAAASTEPAQSIGAPEEEADPSQPVQQMPPKLGGDSVWFAMERTPCFGTCPAYKLLIMPNGSATYIGRRFAPREGIYTGKVDAATMKALGQAVEASGFSKMDDVYDRPVTDLPSTIIRFRTGGQDKQVVGRVGPPQAFKDLAKRAEELLANVEWTRVGEER